MAQKDTFGSLFGKAKKWAQEELKNATRVGGDPIEHRRAREANEARADELQLEAERAAGTAVVETLLPGVKDWQDTMDRNRAQAEQERAVAARADREQRAGRASVRLSGWLQGEIRGLAVRTTADDEARTLFVEVEAVDPVPAGGASFLGFTFQLPDFHGDGTYQFVDDIDFDGMQYALWVDRDDEGWFYHPSYGPGSVVVVDGVADVRLTFASAGSERVQLHAGVRLDA